MSHPAQQPVVAIRRTRSGGLSRTGAHPSSRAAFLRDVTLEADFDPITRAGSLAARVQVGGLFSGGLAVVVHLENREPAAEIAVDSIVQLHVDAGEVEPWSAEIPRLHAVLVELVDKDGARIDSVTLQAGYRRIEPSAGALIVNGTPVAITGIMPRFNDGVALSPTAWTGTEEWIAARLVHLKKFNINAIRVSRPSIDPLFLAYADQIGFYVIDGTDDESERLAEQFASDPRHPEVAEGAIHPAMYELRRRFSPVEFASTVDELAAGILRLRNEQFFAGLNSLTITAHVVTTCGVDDGVALEVVAAPGETVLVDLPESLLYELAGDTVLALRLIVRTAENAIWAHAGTEIAVLQLTMREHVELELPAASGGLLYLDPHGILTHPLLSAGPRLCLWSASGHGDAGLPGLQRRLETIEWSDDESTAVVTATYTTATGHEVLHTQRVRRLLDSTLHFEEAVEVPEALGSVPRIGMVFETRPGFENVEWIGDGPHETYPGRRSSALHGQWSSSVTDLPVPYLRPRENGGRANVTWADLSDGVSSFSLAFDRGLQFSASHFSIDDLEAAEHWWQLEPREQTIVHLDVAHSGGGAAESAADADAAPVIGPGRYEWSWTLDARESRLSSAR